jgi:hypothetical protein
MSTNPSGFPWFKPMRVTNDETQGNLSVVALLGSKNKNVFVMQAVVAQGSRIGSAIESRLLFALAGIPFPDAETIKAYTTRPDPLPEPVQRLIAWLDDTPMRTLQLLAMQQIQYDLFERVRSKTGRFLPASLVQLADLARADPIDASLRYVLSTRQPVHIISDDAKYVLFALCWQALGDTKGHLFVACDAYQIKRKERKDRNKPWSQAEECMEMFHAINDYVAYVHRNQIVMAVDSMYAVGIKRRKQILAECAQHQSISLPQREWKRRKFLCGVLALRLVRSTTDSVPKYMQFAQLE